MVMVGLAIILAVATCSTQSQYVEPEVGSELTPEEFAAVRREAEEEHFDFCRREDHKEWERLSQEIKEIPQRKAAMAVTILPNGDVEVTKMKDEHYITAPFYRNFSDMPPVRFYRSSIGTETAESKLKEWKSKAIETLKTTGSIEINDKVYMIQPGGSVEFGEITYEENDNG